MTVKALMKRAMFRKKSIRPDSWLESAKQVLTEYDESKARISQWEARRRLVDIRIEADRQIALLRKCEKDVKRAESIKMDRRERKDFVEAYHVGLFGELGDRKKLKEKLGNEENLKTLGKNLKKEDFDYPEHYEHVVERNRLRSILEIKSRKTLRAAIRMRIDLYKDLLGTVRQKKVRLFALHAVFRLSEGGGLQLGSLAVGSVIVLGMFYMWFYYQAAAGQFVHRYWTLDDLIIQGINAAWLVVLVVLVLEPLFRWLLRGFERQKNIGHRYARRF